MNRILLSLVLVAFGALTTVAVARHGYLGLLTPQFQSLATLQVFLDLVIALALCSVWLWRDARSRGRNPWPWLALTLVAGSFGPLGYLWLRSREAAQ